MMNCFKKTIIFTLLVMLMCTVTACAKPDNAAEFIYLTGSFEDVTITNAIGEYYRYEEDKDSIYDDDEVYTGTMKIYKEDSYDGYGDDGPSLYKLVVPDSEYFRLEATDKDAMMEQQVDFELKNKYNKWLSVFTEYVKRIEIKKKEVIITGEKGSDYDYALSALLPKYKGYFNVSGINSGIIHYRYNKDRVVISGIKGKTKIGVVSSKDSKGLGRGLYYLYGNEATITLRNGKMIVNPCVEIPQESKKNIKRLYLQTANSGKNMFLSWYKVRKAKSYVIYKYDSEEGEYKKVAVRNGNSSNYYNIMNADDGAVYKYRIAAMSKRKGKGKKVCRISYPVWAVSESHTKGNIAKITTNKKSLKGKRGKIAKLRASVETNNGKPSLSSKIRWYSSNTKVAKVNMKTGKVKFKKKGKCYIWAKAHNGKNIQKINVTVN